MAKPTTDRWTKLSIWPEDDNSPGNYAPKVCGLISKEFTIAATTADSQVPDCDDPDLPAWVERIVQALSSQVTGSGLMAEENFGFWRDWSLSGVSKPCRIVVDLQSAPGYFQGDYLLTNFGLPANRSDGKINVNLTLQSDGQVTWVEGSP